MGEIGIHTRKGEVSSLLQADRVVHPIEITYANKATQVDIQRLKVNSHIISLSSDFFYTVIVIIIIVNHYHISSSSSFLFTMLYIKAIFMSILILYSLLWEITIRGRYGNG